MPKKYLLRFLMLQKTPDVSLLSLRCRTSSAGNSPRSSWDDLLQPTTNVVKVRLKSVTETCVQTSRTAWSFSERTLAQHFRHWYVVVRSKHMCWICSRCHGSSQMFCRHHISWCLLEDREPDDFMSLGTWDKHDVKVLEVRRDPARV